MFDLLCEECGKLIGHTSMDPGEAEFYCLEHLPEEEDEGDTFNDEVEEKEEEKE